LKAVKYVAFLRAINVGGRIVTMAELKRVFTALGLRDVETFIASGNVLFSTNARSLPALERKIEAHLHDALGYEVKTFLRTPVELAAIVRHEPFPPARRKAWRSLNVGFLGAPLDAATAKALLAMRTDVDDLHTHGRELYWLCKAGQGDSKINLKVFEKTLKCAGTFRNITTVTRLADRMAS
jgi:uncharacterized protein (DUF1697 family)